MSRDMNRTVSGTKTKPAILISFPENEIGWL
jgi:hypothetical protein